MHRQKFARLIHRVQFGQRRMQAVEAAEIEHAARVAGCRRNQFAAQSGQRRIAVRHHRCQPVQRAAQDDHDEALLRRGVGQRQRGAAQREGRGKPEQGGTAGEGENHRL